MPTDDTAGGGTSANPGGVAGEPEGALDETERHHRERSASPLGVAAIVVVVTLGVTVAFLSLTGRIGEAYTALETAVQTATGWPGLGIVFAYSALIAVVLPLPSEVVLAAPLDLGLGEALTLGLIVVVSGAGKAVGSLAAFHVGQEAKEAGPIVWALRRSRFDILEWSETKTVQLAQRFGYVGLGLALCVPGFPDTISIYAFSVLEENYVRFAAATFAGSVGRLLVWIGLAEATLAVF